MILDDIRRNWKTTAAAAVLAALVIAFLMGKINLDQFIAAFGGVTAAGLAAAKDGDKGGTASGSGL